MSEEERYVTCGTDWCWAEIRNREKGYDVLFRIPQEEVQGKTLEEKEENLRRIFLKSKISVSVY